MSLEKSHILYHGARRSRTGYVCYDKQGRLCQIISCNILLLSLFGVFRPTREFFAHFEMSTLPVKGFKF